MEIIIGLVVVVVALGIMGSLSLRADMSDRFSLARQAQDQKTCISLYDVETRERKLLRWVIVLAASVVVLALTTASGTIGFLTEGAKGYGNTNEAMLQAAFFGMTLAPVLMIIVAYHLIGMIVRLRAWRQVLLEVAP